MTVNVMMMKVVVVMVVVMEVKRGSREVQERERGGWREVPGGLKNERTGLSSNGRAINRNELYVLGHRLTRTLTIYGHNATNTEQGLSWTRSENREGRACREDVQHVRSTSNVKQVVRTVTVEQCQHVACSM